MMMLRKTLVTFAAFIFACSTAAGQSASVQLNYQSFRPYIHFSLQIGSRPTFVDAYEAAYAKGYMDGVNNRYYDAYRFYELVRDIDAYEAGYIDGQQDRALYARLQGRRQLLRQPFAYYDYYTPTLAIQLWLDQLSFTFIKAPNRYLPSHWARRLPPHIYRYRQQINHSPRFYSRFEAHYRKRHYRLRNELQQRQKRSRRQYAQRPTRQRSVSKHEVRQRLGQSSYGARQSRSRSSAVRTSPSRRTSRQQSMHRAQPTRSRGARVGRSSGSKRSSSGVKQARQRSPRVSKRSKSTAGIVDEAQQPLAWVGTETEPIIFARECEKAIVR